MKGEDKFYDKGCPDIVPEILQSQKQGAPMGVRVSNVTLRRQRIAVSEIEAPVYIQDFTRDAGRQVGA